MARAVASATAVALRAGEGAGGAISTGETDGCGSICSVGIGGLGKSRSMPPVAYVSTATFPACAAPRTYLPRLNPATGMGRSATQRVTCSSIAIAVAVGAVIADGGESGAGLPVARRVQAGG